MNCSHKRFRTLNLTMPPSADSPFFLLVLTAHCIDCGATFELVGDPEISADRRELRALFTETIPGKVQ